MSPDPLAGDILNPQSLNRYTYVMNNPTNWTDPLGLFLAGPGLSIFDPFLNDGLAGLAGVGVGGPVTPGTLGPRGGGGGTGTRKPPRSPQTQVSCAALREEAAQLGATLESMSHSAGLGAAGLWFTTAIGAAFELPSFGSDSPVTVALGSGAAFFTAAAIDTGAVGSALSSFASGNLNQLESFAFNQIEDLALKGLASGIPKVGPWAEHLANAAQQAQDLANEAPGACK
jgi:hypothetical protein